MIKDKVIKQINNLKPKYLIIGAKHDGYRGLPIQYEIVKYICTDLKEIYKLITDLVDFKIYTIGNEFKSKDYFLVELEEFNRKKQNTTDFEQYKKLKEKFEK